jgi:hypothetical protein
VENFIRSLNYALDCSQHRLRWYSDTGDKKYLDDCKEWLEVVDVYLNQIILEQKSENCNY